MKTIVGFLVVVIIGIFYGKVADMVGAIINFTKIFRFFVELSKKIRKKIRRLLTSKN
ncbi:hypothetical protein SH2C18_44840 [Clostridium sediminicola]|uniref:hypothetical protein n=1 Tax=Clostridium sediminicola TaxID=3114879 RepID=UPI0031F26890